MQPLRHRSCLIFFLLLLLYMPQAEADEASALFNEAYNSLNSGDYTRAREFLAQLNDAFPNHQNAAQYIFFEAKACYYAGDLDRCTALLERLIKDYPASEYIPYSYLFLGNSHYRKSEPDEALELYLESYLDSQDRELDNILLPEIESAVASCKPEAIEKVRSVAFPEGRKCPLMVALARGLIKAENHQSVVSLLSGCQDAESMALAGRSREHIRRRPEIAVVLPLSGDFQKYGEQLLDGINLMIDQYTKETGAELTPLMYDTRGDNLEAARIIRKLSDSGITAAIGPLTSEETSVASAALACGDMPLIIPAASQAGLTALSETSFQLQANLDWQGIRMADLAASWLKADTAAIITPTSTESLRMARAFAERFKKSGGTVVAVEYFRFRETDFSDYIKDIKSQIVGGLDDSMKFINENGDTLEAEEIPVHLDCIYIPANAAQLQQLLPQLHFYNLNAVYLGGDGWGDGGVYGLGKAVTKNCYFSSSVLKDIAGESGRKFALDFSRYYNRQPGRLEALGYDAMGLLCGAMKADNYSRAEITRYLSGVADYSGAAGAVTFGKFRENIEMPIYTIENGAPRRIVFQLSHE